MAARERIRTSSTKVLSSIILALGILIVVRTLAAGGGPASAGVLVGVVFVGIGVARLYLATRPRA
jgi:hypothetical protein